MIIVDDVRIKWRNGRYSHLASTESEDELHTFAQKIGLKRKWYQDRKFSPHYDVSENFREFALLNGATPVSQSKLVRTNFRSKFNQE